MESRVEQAKQTAEEVAKKLGTLPKETGEYDLFVKIESSLAFTQLIDVLIHKMAKSDKTELDGLFKPLFELFIRRWMGIKKTDASYSHAPRLNANFAYKQAAAFATIYFLKHVFELLMPTVKWNDFFDTCSNAIGLHEFILDDAENPMHVLRTFFMDENQNISQLFYKSVNGIQEELQSLERIRLSNHSDIVSEYFLSFEAKEIDEKQNLEWKTKLTNAFNEVEKPYHVTSSYRQEGDFLLKQYIFSQVNTLEELVDLMRLHIPERNDWKEFLCRCPSEYLCRIILGMNVTPSLPEQVLLAQADIELNNKVQNLKVVYEEEDRVRACIYSLRELYNRTRNNAPEAKSNLGMLANCVLPTRITGFFSKTRKLNSSDVFGEFLLSGHDLDDLGGYLLSGGARKEPGLYEAHWEPLHTDSYEGSTLVKLVQLTTDAGKEIRQNNKPRLVK